MAKGRVADVVYQPQRLGQLRIQPQRQGQRARNLGHFQCMGQAAAEMVRRRIAGPVRKHLRLAGQPSKRPRMKNPRPIPGKRRAIGMRRFAMYAPRQFPIVISADGNPRGQFGRRSGSRIHHRSSSRHILWRDHNDIFVPTKVLRIQSQ